MAKAVTYRDTGVDITANARMVELIGRNALRTYGPRGLPVENGFSGLFSSVDG